MIEWGYCEGDICGREGCEGELEDRPVESCTCFLGNPPCSACTTPREYCPVCEWESIDGDPAEARENTAVETETKLTSEKDVKWELVRGKKSYSKEQWEARQWIPNNHLYGKIKAESTFPSWKFLTIKEKPGTGLHVYCWTAKSVQPLRRKNKAFMAFSARWSEKHKKFVLSKVSFRRKKMDAANLAAKWRHEKVFEGIENPPNYAPLYFKKEISEERREEMRERGKKLAASQKLKNTISCPRCHEPIKKPIKKILKIRCGSCERIIMLV